ncbi:MAG: helix-turn-helix domain-containing protein [Actinobacteria bacterium]|nr:helix-turn-helix domain-containing protein [Actinomycetota bacterium]
MPAPGWEPVVRAAEAAQRRLDEVVSRSADAVLQEVPEYNRVARAQLEEALRRNQALAFLAYREHRRLQPDELALLTDTVEQRARNGLPLEGVLMAFARAGRVSWDVLHDELTKTAAPHELVLEALELRTDILNQMVGAAAAAHRRGELVIDREAQERQAQGLRLLLRGAVAHESLAEHVRRLGLDLDQQVYVVRARSVEPLPFDQLQRVLAQGVPEPPRAVLALWGEDVVGLLEAPPPSGSAAWVAGVAGPVAVSEVEDAWVEASRAFDAALTFRLRGPHRVEDLRLRLLIQTEPWIRQVLLDRYVAPLRGTGGMPEELLRTVQVYLECGGRRELAGQRLHLHHNTVAYRVGRFCQFTGADLDDHETLAELWWVFRLLEAEAGSARQQ